MNAIRSKIIQNTKLDRLAHNKRILDARWKRIEAGLCRDCGLAPHENGRVVCDICHENRSRNGKKFKAAQIAKGLCAKCGNINENTGKFLCNLCLAKQIERMRVRRKENKEFIINYFGGKCKECGEKDIRCLSLDHVNNDGYLDKKSSSGNRQVTPTWYAKLVKLIKSKKELPRELQLLCFNCHAKKDLSPWWYDDKS